MNMQDATWGMYLNVRYFPYPKICFSYLKIRQAVHFESLRSHAHFVLLCSSGMQIVVESSGPELKMCVLIPPSRDVDDKEIYIDHQSSIMKI